MIPKDKPFYIDYVAEKMRIIHEGIENISDRSWTLLRHSDDQGTNFHLRGKSHVATFEYREDAQHAMRCDPATMLEICDAFDVLRRRIAILEASIAVYQQTDDSAHLRMSAKEHLSILKDIGTTVPSSASIIALKHAVEYILTTMEDDDDY